MASLRRGRCAPSKARHAASRRLDAATTRSENRDRQGSEEAGTRESSHAAPHFDRTTGPRFRAAPIGRLGSRGGSNFPSYSLSSLLTATSLTPGPGTVLLESPDKSCRYANEFYNRRICTFSGDAAMRSAPPLVTE